MRKFVSFLVILSMINTNSFALECRGYLYAGSTPTYTRYVERTNCINLCCPDYFEIGTGGVLKLTRPVDDAFVSDMHSRNVQVVPFVSNHWSRDLGRLALSNRDALSDQLVRQVVAHDLDGIDVDIENINHDDRADYTAFIKLLRGKLPPGKTLSVCVASNPWGGTTGWQGAYDYAALGKLADTVFVMTYDESYEGGEPGAVASLKFIKDSMAFALKHVPASKVMMGIPLYGRYWRAGEPSGGKAFTLSDIGRITENYSSVTWYNADAECARATVTVSPKDLEAGLWGSKKLTAGVYDIWYENDASMEKKLRLVRDLGLGGAAVWALGYEPEELWSGYPVWLRGYPFSDIENHWARTHITAMYDKGILAGDGKGRYLPDGITTRAEMTALACKLLNLKPSDATSGFADTANHWADGYISAAREHKIVAGNGADENFAPDRPITREEAAVLLERVIHIPKTLDFSENRFPDVSPELTPWSNNAIVELAAFGVLSGDPDGNFRPKANCTRADMATLAAKLSALQLKLPCEDPVIEPR